MKRNMYGRERIPFMPVTEVPQTQCPRCGKWIDDNDGFGVLAHGACGYCSHPSTLDGTCGICGELRDGDPATMRLMKGDTVTYTDGTHTVLDWAGNNGEFIKLDFKGYPKWVGRRECVFVKRAAVYQLFRAMTD